ncbi:hypothetical protein APY03_4059 [Variovorax sp. WDL1]|nr:hypothetical protein APY03_4059 [Variovorax sp. WDL1]
MIFRASLVCHQAVAFLKPPAFVATRGTFTILLTWMPGVTMASGSSSPSSLVSSP